MQYIQAQDWVNSISIKNNTKHNLSGITPKNTPRITLFLGEDISLINSLKQTYTEIKNSIYQTGFDIENSGSDQNTQDSCDTLFDSCNIHFIDDAIPDDINNISSQNSLYVLTSTNAKLWQKYKNDAVQCVMCDKIQNQSIFVQNWSKYYNQEYNTKVDAIFDKYIHNLYILKIFWNLRDLRLQTDEIQYVLSSYLEPKKANSKFSYTNTSLFFYSIFVKKDLVEF